jgi:HSP20 family protein
MLGELQPWFSAVCAWPSLERFRRDMDELFTRFFGEGYHGPSSSMRPWPAVDSYLKDGKWIMRFELPGIEPKDIDVSVAGDTLIVRALRERRSDQRNSEKREGNYARFEHSLTLPKGAQADQINACYEHGVLELSIPASLEVMGRKILVEIGKEDRAQLEHQAA